MSYVILYKDSSGASCRSSEFTDKRYAKSTAKSWLKHGRITSYTIVGRDIDRLHKFKNALLCAVVLALIVSTGTLILELTL